MSDKPQLHSDMACDASTSSNFRDVRIKHYKFYFEVKFDVQEIFSHVQIECEALNDCHEVILDVHDSLTVVSAVNVYPSQSLDITVTPFTDYGSTLTVSLPQTYERGEHFLIILKVVVKGGRGVVWLDPLQTAGKKMPYLYTQGQAVMNRSFFPCQDTPMVKSTFSANVRVPDGFTVLMSCNKNKVDFESDSVEPSDTYYFEQMTPVPVYLIAMAVGDIKGARIGPRSMVYAEPCVLERAKKEFDGVVEDFITTGERLFGAYVWDRYDILIMPPSFPYGGMENPCLTFVTPCILVGDKSLTDVVIHEISHSWFGNLVTNASWGEFWLNEGFTMYAQRRIMEELYGSEYTCLEASVGQALLEQTIKDIGEDHPLSCLRVIISPGVDPDDTYNETPYEKGFCFVSYLQHLVGDKQTFDGFLKDYVETFKYQSIMSEDFLDYFLNYFPHLKEAQVDKRSGLEFDQWLTKPGRPLYQPDLSARYVLTQPADELANLFLDKDITVTEDVSKWKSYQILYFLDRILDMSPIPEANMKIFIDSFTHIVHSDNSEILLRWSKVIIRNNIESHFKTVRDFLNSQGKIKYTVPIYRELVAGSDVAKKLAREVYESTKVQLHCEVTRRVEAVLESM